MNSFFKLGAGLFCCALPAVGQAQTNPATNEPHTVIEYFDARHNKLASAEGADTRVETHFTDSLHAVKRTYLADGTMLSAWPYEHYRKHILHGLAEEWYKNGQLRWRDPWVHGQRNGELVAYYPTGQLKRREQYVANKSMGGTCYAPNGEVVAFYPFEQMPTPPGGMQGLMSFLGKNIRYPAVALRSHTQGIVMVKFMVDSLGRVQDIAVAQSLHPALDEEALRVIAMMPPWQPGRQDGKPVQVVYTVPITFTIAGVPPRRKKRPEAAEL